MTIETDRDLQGLQTIGRIVARVLKTMMDRVEPGMTTAELDAMGGEMLTAAGARSAPRLCYGFPGETCISINEEAAHGLPGPRRIEPGDVVNIDVSAELDGYFADTGGTLVVPPALAEQKRLLAAAREALQNASTQARAGAPLNRIGRAIEGVARRHRFELLRNLCSHGIGRALHEEPEAIPGHYDRRDRRRLHEGQVITIEPFLSTHSRAAHDSDDGWTLVTDIGNRSAQFEHTMVITRGAPLLLTVA
jgi:methionyl aminopeptidase